MIINDINNILSSAFMIVMNLNNLIILAKQIKTLEMWQIWKLQPSP